MTIDFIVDEPRVEAFAATLRRKLLRPYERLVALNNTYDPTNPFRLNANIRPSVRE